MNIPTDRNAIVVPVPRSMRTGAQLKDAASFCWVIQDDQFLDETELVLAANNGTVIGVYEMRGWYHTDDLNLGPNALYEENWDGRVGFVLIETDPRTQARYFGTQVSKFLQSPKFIKTENLVAA